MAYDARTIMWEAPEHRHIEKTNDWYWALGIIAITGSVVSIIMHNVLFGIVILLGASTMIVFSHRHPQMRSYEISMRGIRIDNTLYPYSSLDSFCIDEESHLGPQLIVKSKQLLMSLIIFPIPEEYIDEIESIMKPKLREEHIDEPLSHQLMEYLGF